MGDANRKYRINVVAEMTGVSAATLRAWERRYGVPVPDRTESSYRLYGKDDIEIIKRLQTLCADGMSPSEAAKVVLEERRADPPPAIDAEDPYRPTQAAILEAVESFAPERLEHAVQHAMALGSAWTVYDRVFRPVMMEVGERWHRGELTVGQEHLATHAMESAARRMLSLIQPSGSARQIVLGSFVEDEHTMPLYGIALHLAGAGFRIVMLGARTPPGAIRQAVRELQPACVGLSCTLEPPMHKARELIDAYADACQGVPWVVGGRAASKLRDFIEARGGVVSPEDDARQMMQRLEGLIVNGRRHRGGGASTRGDRP